jgi:hypothetical protein
MLTPRLEDGPSKMYTGPMHSTFMVRGQIVSYDSVLRRPSFTQHSLRGPSLGYSAIDRRT